MTEKRPNDLDNIGEVLLSFFNTERIGESLRLIHKNGLTGWEKWWQTEFALYLATENEMIAEWDMEHLFDVDKRTSLEMKRIALDIGFRLKRQQRDEWYFVELKQDDAYRICIDRMCQDADKVFCARRKSFEGLKIKYIACAGVFLTHNSQKEVLDYAEEALDSINVDHDGFFIEKVSQKHSVLIF
ncbi:MAG TPA: hypothetical protein VG962_04975 [Steroidobacteraceae bacterium]|nr:hypothetical protein [Steroidobacteraceae bacterium]